jgi:uncharacterized Zn finger protein (UPF0148 family)
MPHHQFKSHLEFINHITCSSCNHYWTYATMNPKFRINRGEWFCPLCGRQGNVQEEDHRSHIEEVSFFSQSNSNSKTVNDIASSETTTDWFPDPNPTDWFPDLSLSLKSVSPSDDQTSRCACGENKTCQCDDE